MDYVAGRGTTALGVIGTVLGGIGTAGVLGGGASLLGGMRSSGCTSENMPVSRYELSQAQEIDRLRSEVALRDANVYNDQKTIELYKYVDSKFDAVNTQLSQQAVVNAQITANISCMQNTISVLQSLTKTIVPIDNVCPQPMPQYNSWTAPTTTTTTTT